MSVSGLGLSSGRLRVGVIGAGVVGLSTAFRLLQQFADSVQVENLADKFDTDTTSDGRTIHEPRNYKD